MADQPVTSNEMEFWGGPKDGQLLPGFGYPYGSTVWLSAEGYYRMELRKRGEGQEVCAAWHEDRHVAESTP